jgi:DNA polymerase/3'-5' exonuclease PolX
VAAADTQTVARLLREYAQQTALRGGNPYRAKAYSRAADSLAVLTVPLHVLIEENRLPKSPAWAKRLRTSSRSYIGTAHTRAWRSLGSSRSMDSSNQGG